jgi:hypothetical protein
MTSVIISEPVLSFLGLGVPLAIPSGEACRPTGALRQCAVVDGAVPDFALLTVAWHQTTRDSLRGIDLDLSVSESALADASEP